MPIKNIVAHPVIRSHGHWMLGGIVAITTIAASFMVPNWANASRHDPQPLTKLEIDVPQLAPQQADPAIAALAALDNQNWRIVAVKLGQSLSDVFQEQGFAASDLQRALDSQDDASALRRLRPGNEFAFDVSSDGSLLAMRFDRGDAARVVLRFDGDSVREEVEDRAVERRVEVAHGVVNRSLFEAGDQAGMSDSMTLKLANAFGYDIDFAQDLRQGDSFSVIYDTVYRDGEQLRGGDILAATFINQGTRYTALRYTNSSGETLYYRMATATSSSSSTKASTRRCTVTCRDSPTSRSGKTSLKGRPSVLSA